MPYVAAGMRAFKVAPIKGGDVWYLYAHTLLTLHILSVVHGVKLGKVPKALSQSEIRHNACKRVVYKVSFTVLQ